MNHHQINENYNSNSIQENQSNPNEDNNNFVSDFINNPKEAIAKEIIGRAEENLSKGWAERFGCCNFE